nr:hypothetical protein [Nonomuraea guangzhouensis]
MTEEFRPPVPSQQLRNGLAECPHHRRGGRIDYDDRQADVAGDRGGLSADEPGTDDHHSRFRPPTRSQCQRVVQSAQIVDAGQVVTGQPPCGRAGGDDQAVVVDRLAFGQRELPPMRIQAGCGGAQPQVQVQLVSCSPLRSRSRSGFHWPDSNCLDSEGWP